MSYVIRNLVEHRVPVEVINARLASDKFRLLGRLWNNISVMLSQTAAEEQIRQDIIEQLEQLKERQPTSRSRHTLEFLLQHAKTFTKVSPLPPRTRRTPKGCFGNANRFVCKWPNYFYCEGWRRASLVPLITPGVSTRAAGLLS